MSLWKPNEKPCSLCFDGDKNGNYWLVSQDGKSQELTTCKLCKGRGSIG